MGRPAAEDAGALGAELVRDGLGAALVGLGAGLGGLGRGERSAFGNGPLRTPEPLASSGSTRSQPGLSTSPSVKVSPSGCVRPSLSSTISRNRLPLPRVRRAMA
ncbi:hypothetical protein GA0070617_4470 [Micromonospora yangpuensis]|uniref:Uncharacterized protein n=1 Tax=Micromonospora yangpuensis TaxID=683228 RepID=A0A1C6V3F9_9ACTN|nr:hypothetical protein GA0070617_4470 [Micromonospora yangpuensis]